MKRFTLLLLTTGMSLAGNAQTVITVAGDGSPTYYGDGGPATQAALNDPTSIALDGSGHLLIADQLNNVIRQLDLATGIITTLPTPSLNWPSGIAVDKAGNIFIADQINSVIRKWTKATGIWSIVAGNFSHGYPLPNVPAYTTCLNDPVDIEVDPAGNVYIADWGNGFVEKVDAATGYISGVPGSYLDGPVRLCFDNNGNLLIAVESDNIVYKFNPATNAITVAAQFLNGPTGVIVDPAGDLFIAEAYGNTIDELSASTGTLRRYAGTGTGAYGGDGGPLLNASFNSPRDFAIDASGNMYIADSHNNRIREIITCHTPIGLTGPTAVCNGDTAVLKDPNGQGTWNTGNASSVLVNDTGRITGAGQGTSLLTCAVTPGCAPDTLTVIVLATPPHQQPHTFSICTGDSVLFDPGAGAVTYQWNDGNIRPTQYGHTVGTYTVTVKGSNGCATLDTFAIAGLYPLPVLSWPDDTVVCQGSTFSLTTPPGLQTIQWQDGSTAPTYTVGKTGVYWVHVTDQNGCKGADTLDVNTLDVQPPAYLPTDTSFCRYSGIKLVPRASFTTYAWSTGSIQPVLAIQTAGTYGLQVTDLYGCTWENSVTVTETNCENALFFPNAFTPNNDGSNDLFKPVVVGVVLQYHLVVFDRWGTKVFESHNPGDGWDGYCRSVPQATGTYVWFAEYQLPGNPPQTAKGSLLLIH